VEIAVMTSLSAIRYMEVNGSQQRFFLATANFSKIMGIFAPMFGQLKFIAGKRKSFSEIPRCAWILICLMFIGSTLNAQTQTAVSPENNNATALITDSSASQLSALDSARHNYRYHRAVLLKDTFCTIPDSTPYRVDENGLKVAVTPMFRKKDPLSPFENKLYFRHGQSKFWFIGVGLVFLFMFYYYRSAFAKQFELRIKGVFSSYYFEEMMNEKSFEHRGGSAVVLIMSNLVFALGIMLYLRFGGFLNMNAGWFYWLVLGLLLVAVFLLQAIQYLFALSIDITETVARQVQRQLNINFVLALLFLPIFVFVYYNAYKIKEVDIVALVSFMLIIWIVARSVLSFVGLSRDNHLDFTTFLYFCSLEVIPYAVFFSLLSRT
jgi:hypothetical protein